MAKLYFRYGTVSSAKTLNLLATVHNYEQQNKKAVLVKPCLDTRTEKVTSRAGLEHTADIIIKKDESFLSYIPILSNCDAIVVDEVQFLSEEQIKELRLITIGKLGDTTLTPIPVLCYGLRTTSEAELWDSVKVLMALADSIEEVKTTCAFCNRKAIFSKSVSKDIKGVVMSWDAFIPVCANHYYGE